MKKIYLLAALFFVAFSAIAQLQEESIPDTAAEAQLLKILNRIYQYRNSGNVALAGDVATFTIPTGFKFLDDTSSRFVLEKLWGNMEDASVLGMVFPANLEPRDTNVWAFVITYQELGYVEDKDAEDINYDDLLEDMKKDVVTENTQRSSLGYETVELIGWASTPFYDAEKKALHWAKEIKFGESTYNTVNYDLRLLGRKGVLSFNAVGSTADVDAIKKAIPAIITGANFNSGYKYSEFDPDIDTVAAYTIGGLVAGKVLAKAGVLVLLAKFWKFILIGLAAAGGFITKFFRGRKSPNDNGLLTNKNPGDTTINNS